jgi:hypothetical protein
MAAQVGRAPCTRSHLEVFAGTASVIRWRLGDPSVTKCDKTGFLADAPYFNDPTAEAGIKELNRRD